MLRLEPVVPVPPHWRPACIGRTQLRHVSGEVELRPWLSLRLRFYGRTARASDCVARNDQLHSAILLPAAVSLVATGWILPNPRETMEDVTMPCLARKSRTEFARFSDKRMLSSSVPTLSVWPSTPSVRVGYAPSVEQRAERIHRLVDS